MDEKPSDVFITADNSIDTSITEFGNTAKLYIFKDAERLLNVCNYHSYVWINERKRVRGKDVALKDAVKLFEKYAKTKEEHEALSDTREKRLYEQYMYDEY